jgi:hypothetical protein
MQFAITIYQKVHELAKPLIHEMHDGSKNDHSSPLRS